MLGGKIAGWAYQWNMSSNFETFEQVVKVHFSSKINPMDTSPVCFNNLAVPSSETYKHLDLLFDKRLDYNRHTEETILMANKGIELIIRLRRYLPRNSLLTI